VAAIIRVVNELQRPDLSAARTERILQTDANLCYRLLRFVNSATAATTQQVESVKQAAILMGIGRIRSLASMMLLSAVDENKPRELIKVAMMRAKMCELLARAAAEADSDRFYTLGLFSVLDALLDQPMEEVVNKLPLSSEMKAALVRRSGRLGEVLTMVTDYERGVTRAGDRGEVSEVFEQTLRWMATTENSSR
ncbi:MAG: HDOD domain-containing protein, partial [Planctomycetota bacterium]